MTFLMPAVLPDANMNAMDLYPLTTQYLRARQHGMQFNVGPYSEGILHIIIIIKVSYAMDLQVMTVAKI